MVNRTMQRMEVRMNRVAQQARRMLLIGGIAFAGLIKVASDYQENISKFRAVFKEQSDAVLEWARVTAKATGRAVPELVKFLAIVQDTFVPLGFARERAAELSEQVVQLAIDLASFNNVSEPEVIQSLTSALTGQGRALLRYGVVINEATIKAKAFTLGIKKSAREMTPAEKAAAILAITIDSTSDAQGDAARTSHEFANQLRALKAEVLETAVHFGSKLLPAVTEWVATLKAVIPEVAAWIEKNQQLIVSIVKWGAATAAVLIVLAPLLSITASFVSVLAAVGPLMVVVATAVAVAFAPLAILEVVLLAVAAAAITVSLWLKGLEKDLDDSAKASKKTAEMWRELKDAQDELADAKGPQAQERSLRAIATSLEKLKKEQLEIARSEEPWHIRNNAAGNAAKLADRLREINQALEKQERIRKRGAFGPRPGGTVAPIMESKEVIKFRKDVDSLTTKLQLQAATWGMAAEQAAIYELQLRRVGDVSTLNARLAAQNIEFIRREDELMAERLTIIKDEAQARADKRDAVLSELDALKELAKTDKNRDTEAKKRIELFRKEGLLTDEQADRLLKLRDAQDAVNSSIESFGSARERILASAASRRRSATAGASAVTQQNLDASKTASNTTTIAQRTKVTNDKLDGVILAIKTQELGFK